MHRREIVKSEIEYDNEMCVCLQFSYQTFSKLAGVPYLSRSLNARNKTQSYIDSYKRTGQSYRTGQNIFTGVPFGVKTGSQEGGGSSSPILETAGRI